MTATLSRPGTAHDHFVHDVADWVHEAHCPGSGTQTNPMGGTCRCRPLQVIEAEVRAVISVPWTPPADGGRFHRYGSRAWQDVEATLAAPGVYAEFVDADHFLCDGMVEQALGCLIEAQRLAELSDGADA